MTAALSELTVEEAAKQAAGNWRDFDSFVWHRRNEIADPDNWAIFYTHHRDSGLLDESNASVIETALRPFSEADDPDVVLESHSHWLVGHVDGFSIRVFRNGEITDACRTYRQLQERITDYPILDEEDEATLAAIDRGVQSADDGRLVPLEEVRQRMNRWLTKSSSPKTRSVI